MTRKEFRDQIRIGSIVYTSWGYDQTNVDVYEVVGTYATYGVVLRPVALESEADTGPFSDRVRPVPGEYIGPPFRKLVQAGYVKIDRQHAWLWDGERTFHRSWGH